MKQLFLIAFVFLAQLNTTAQVSFGGGLSLTNFMNTTGAVGQSFNMPGFHGHIEVPRSGDVTLYGRVNYLLPKANNESLSTTYVTAINTTTNPIALQVNTSYKTNYFLFEGGNRYYLGNDYDNGFAGYGGSGLMLGLGKVKKTYDEKDVSGTISWANEYQKDPAEIQEGNIFTIGGYLQGGIKYTIPATGTIYADMSVYYLLLANPSNTTAIETDFISPFFFNFTLGFKKDLY
jgi:hypothetical protein